MGLFSRFVSKIKGESTASSLDWQELESELLASDLGSELTRKIIAEARKVRGDDAEAAIKSILSERLSDKSRDLVAGTPQLIIVVGVNGAGKTTSVAKLAHHLTQSGRKVILGAADTFRAAAVEQLVTWGARTGVEVITGKGDTAAVAFDTAKHGISSGADCIIIDTAGRLHTKNDLMQELGKVLRVVEKITPVTDVLLVIDGTTGRNGLVQAKIFSEAVSVTGLVVTKLDGTARGGIALAVEDELDLPIKFIGTGEGAGDISPFEADSYIEGLVTQD